MTPPQNPSPSKYSLHIGTYPSASSVPPDDSHSEFHMEPNGDFLGTRTASLGGPFFLTATVGSRSGASLSVGIDLFKIFREPAALSPSLPAPTPAPSAPSQVGAAAARASLAHFMRLSAAHAAMQCVQRALAKALDF